MGENRDRRAEHIQVRVIHPTRTCFYRYSLDPEKTSNHVLEILPLSWTLEGWEVDTASSHLHVSDIPGLGVHDSLIHHQRASSATDQRGTDALVAKRGPGTVAGIVLGVKLLHTDKFCKQLPAIAFMLESVHEVIIQGFISHSLAQPQGCLWLCRKATSHFMSDRWRLSHLA